MKRSVIIFKRMPDTLPVLRTCSLPELEPVPQPIRNSIWCQSGKEGTRKESESRRTAERESKQKRIGHGRSPVEIEFSSERSQNFCQCKMKTSSLRVLFLATTTKTTTITARRAEQRQSRTTTNARHHRPYFRATATCAVNVLSLSLTCALWFALSVCARQKVKSRRLVNAFWFCWVHDFSFINVNFENLNELRKLRKF